MGRRGLLNSSRRVEWIVLLLTLYSTLSAFLTISRKTAVTTTARMAAGDKKGRSNSQPLYLLLLRYSDQKQIERLSFAWSEFRHREA